MASVRVGKQDYRQTLLFRLALIYQTDPVARLSFLNANLFKRRRSRAWFVHQIASLFEEVDYFTIAANRFYS